MTNLAFVFLSFFLLLFCCYCLTRHVLLTKRLLLLELIKQLEVKQALKTRSTESDSKGRHFKERKGKCQTYEKHQTSTVARETAMFRLPLIERELRDVLKYIRPAVMEGVYVCGFLLAYIAEKEIVSCI